MQPILVAREGVEPPTTSLFSATLYSVLNNLSDFRWPPKYLRSLERQANRGWKSWVQTVLAKATTRWGGVHSSSKKPSIEDAAVRGNSGSIYYLNECGDDLVPTEGWGNRSQYCLHDVRVIGDT